MIPPFASTQINPDASMTAAIFVAFVVASEMDISLVNVLLIDFDGFVFVHAAVPSARSALAFVVPLLSDDVRCFIFGHVRLKRETAPAEFRPILAEGTAQPRRERISEQSNACEKYAGD
jgi:hypothetical protein